MPCDLCDEIRGTLILWAIILFGLAGSVTASDNGFGHYSADVAEADDRISFCREPSNKFWRTIHKRLADCVNEHDRCALLEFFSLSCKTAQVTYFIKENWSENKRGPTKIIFLMHHSAKKIRKTLGVRQKVYPSFRILYVLR